MTHDRTANTERGSREVTVALLGASVGTANLGLAALVRWLPFTTLVPMLAFFFSIMQQSQPPTRSCILGE